MLNVITVNTRKITFGEAQVMYSIQQIGFAHTIGSCKRNNRFFKLQLLMVVVFELGKRYVTKRKHQVQDKVLLLAASAL